MPLLTNHDRTELKKMYSLKQLQDGLRHPVLIFRELNRYYHTRLRTREYNSTGINIFDEDWDTLIILDACRYDAFEIHSNIPGNLESRQSRASSTIDFLKANFGGRDLTDTVYVTANPQLYRHRDQIDTSLHNVVHVWEDEGWDEEYRTVLPETVTDYAIGAAKKYENKRIIVHYMQPHYPFIHDEIRFGDEHLRETKPDEPNPWYMKLYGELNIPADKLWEAYIANLKKVLPCVERLLDKISGKSVITADHGNMFGERSFPIPIREWGHPHTTYTEELVKIPWLIIDSCDRRKILYGEKLKSTSINSDASERLQQLGYRD